VPWDGVWSCRAGEGAGLLTEVVQAGEVVGHMYVRLLQSSTHAATYVALQGFKEKQRKIC